MPLVLDNPEQLVISVVRITSFSCVIEPLSVTVNYVRGSDGPDGFRLIDGGSATFDAEEISLVDPAGTIYTSMKDALYELLELRLGGGIID